MTLWPMTQQQWHDHAKLCTCGCGGLDATCTTPIPEGLGRDLTEEEEAREALGEWWLARRTEEAEPLSPEEEETLF